MKHENLFLSTELKGWWPLDFLTVVRATLRAPKLDLKLWVSLVVIVKGFKFPDVDKKKLPSAKVKYFITRKCSLCVIAFT